MITETTEKDDPKPKHTFHGIVDTPKIQSNYYGREVDSDQKLKSKIL